MFQKVHQQWFEYIFMFFLVMMGVTFWVNFAQTNANFKDVMLGFVPTSFHSSDMSVSMSLFGAIVMPHNLYLQSSLVMTRKIEGLKKNETRTAVNFFRIETFIIIFMSFIVNMAVIGSFSNIDTSSISGDNFDFISAGELLRDNLGKTCQVLYGIGLFCSGISSTTTGALTGQYVMNGYCDWKFNKNLRIFVTRSIALIPCLIIVGFANMSSANTIMNTIQAIQLPFVLIPLARYIREKTIMKELTFGGFKYWFIIVTAVCLIGLNVWNVMEPFVGEGVGNWQIWTFAPLFSIYIGFLIYLIFVKLDTKKFEVMHKKVREFGKNSRMNSRMNSKCTSKACSKMISPKKNLRNCCDAAMYKDKVN